MGKSIITLIGLVLVWVSLIGAGNCRIHRSRRARHQFEVASGHPNGWKGHIVDHVIPLAAPCYGLDDPSNMQWESVVEAKAKDRWERKECRIINGREEGCCL